MILSMGRVPHPEMDSFLKGFKSYCRQCGGDRSHETLASKTRDWSDDVAPVDGSDTWAVIECRGCQTVTFSHTYWFSEDVEATDEGFRPILHKSLFPPAPERKMPEWGFDLFLDLAIKDHWIIELHKDIYSAAGMNSYALAAMGARAIVDHVVTSNAGPRPKGEDNDFFAKLQRIHKLNLISSTSVSVLEAAFDAGSAAAHRGYKPNKQDLFTLLDITENLLETIYIIPGRQKRQVAAAADLQSRTPPREN